MLITKLIFLGLGAGIFSGMFGIGGGLIIVPFLVLLCGFSLHMALGTSLGALLLPVGLLGVIEYYKAGNVDVKVALIVAIGLFVGTYFGAKIVQPLSPLMLRRIYGVFLIFIAVRMITGK